MGILDFFRRNATSETEVLLKGEPPTCPKCGAKGSCHHFGDGDGGVTYNDLYKFECANSACRHNESQIVYGGNTVSESWTTACPYCGSTAGRGYVTEVLYRNNEFEGSCRLIIPDFQQITLELIEYFSTHPDDLYYLEWRKFEELLEAIFRNQGFLTELGPGRADQGIDLRLVQKDSVGEIITLVQAKRYKPTNPIGLEAVAALYAIVEDQKANRGLFVTTSRYLPVAKRFAENQNRRLMLATSKEVAEWCKSVSNRQGISLIKE